ncbi:MFS transporter [Acidocella sp.]|uniref:MFS transporter n=1 Tax=Acidocella sp. TaxID=50710 RepID=UPI00261BB336|nr:MFS transporter [Acidocella sp.]
MTTAAAAKIAARLDRLPATREIWRLVVLISLGGMFEFYSVFQTGYLVPSIGASGLFSPSSQGMFAALSSISIANSASYVFCLFAGLWVGALFLSPLADRYGRRTMFVGSILWYLTCSLVMAVQRTGEGLILWRFAAGLGFGLELVVMDAYLAELVPAAFRGRAFALNQTITFAIVPVVAWLSWVLVPYRIGALEGWRIVIMLGTVGIPIAMWLALALPESPRWLALHGREAEADAIVTKLEKSAVKPGKILSEPAVLPPERTVTGSFFELLSPRYAERTLMMSIFNIGQVVGFYGFAAWVPTLLIARGIAFTNSMEYSFIIALANPLGPLLTLLIADRFERSVQIMVSLCLMGLFMLGFALSGHAVEIISFGVLFTVAANIMSSAFHAYQAELFPTHVRARGVGFVYSWSRLSAAFAGLAVGYFLNNGGVPAIAVFIGVTMAIAVIIIGAFGPPTRARALENVSH